MKPNAQVPRGGNPHRNRGGGGPPAMASATTTPLSAAWSFTYFKKLASKSYEDNTVTLGTVRSVRIPAPARATHAGARARGISHACCPNP